MVVYIVEQVCKKQTLTKYMGVYKERSRAQQHKDNVTKTGDIRMRIKTYPLMDMQNDVGNIIYELKCKVKNTCFIIGFYHKIENAKKAMQYYKKKFCGVGDFVPFVIVQHIV